jgi:ABC-2 type transport system permease protein
MGFFTFTFGAFFDRGEASLGAFFMWMPWLFLFLVPAVGMRLWSEERRSGTIELLLTFPVTPWQAILGKFLASWIFLGIAMAFTFPVWLTVNWLGIRQRRDLRRLHRQLLLAGTYLAVSCDLRVTNQVVGFILSVVICLALILVGFAPVTDILARSQAR